MFGSKLLVYIKKPSIYNLRKIRSIQDRKRAIQEKMLTSQSLSVSITNREYSQAYQLVAKDKEAEMIKYQKSVLWSPVFTPKQFKYMFLLPGVCVLMLILYIRYIAQPRTLLKYKKKYGISLKQWEKRGWMDAWMDQYNKVDQTLTFEAYTVQDFQVLYKQGLLKGGSTEQRQMQQNRAKTRKSKFVSGPKEFVLKEFNSA